MEEERGGTKIDLNKRKTSKGGGRGLVDSISQFRTKEVRDQSQITGGEGGTVVLVVLPSLLPQCQSHLAPNMFEEEKRVWKKMHFQIRLPDAPANY